jgi:hypothetical protein
MKINPENKNSLDHNEIIQNNLNRMIQVGILKATTSVAYLIGIGFSLLILIIGIGFCSVHFNFVTAALSLIFAIFIFFISYQVDKKSILFIEKISKQKEDQQRNSQR